MIISQHTIGKHSRPDLGLVARWANMRLCAYWAGLSGSRGLDRGEGCQCGEGLLRGSVKTWAACEKL